MPAYNFQPEFIIAVDSGIKRTTIRLPRKRPTVAGDRLYFFTGQRTPGCLRLREHHKDICKAVSPIIILEKNHNIILDGNLLSRPEVENLIDKDTAGVWDDKQFFDFFKKKYGPRFEGEMIAW